MKKMAFYGMMLVGLAARGAVDLGGADMTVTALTGDETFENTSETAATLTLDLADDATWTGSVSGPVRLVKTGAGTLTVDGAGYQGTGGVLIADGILKLGDNCGPTALGAAGTVVAIDGGQLDVNYPAVAGDVTLGTPARDTVTHDVVLHVKGAGLDGNGAIVNSGAGPWRAAQLGRIVLDGDVTLGHGKRLDVEAKSSYTANYGYNDTAIITDNGAGHTLTISNAEITQATPNNVYLEELGLMTAVNVSVGKIRIENGGSLGLEGNGITINAPGGVELGDRGQFVVHHRYHAGAAPVVAADGTSAFLYGRGTINVTNAITVRDGATLILGEYNGGNNVGYGNFLGAVTNDGTILVNTRKNAAFKGQVVNRGEMTIQSTASGFSGATVTNSGTITLAANNRLLFANTTVANTGTIRTDSQVTPGFSNVTFTSAGTIVSTRGLLTFYGYLKSPNEDFTATSSNRGIDFHADAVTLGGHTLALQTTTAHDIWFGGGVKPFVADGPVSLASGHAIDVRDYAAGFPAAPRFDVHVPDGQLVYFCTRGLFAAPTNAPRTSYLDIGKWHFPSGLGGVGLANFIGDGHQDVRTVVTNANWDVPYSGGILLGYNSYEANVAFGAEADVQTRVVQFMPAEGYAARLALEEGGTLTLAENETGTVTGLYLPATHRRGSQLVLNGGTLKAGSDWGIRYKRRDPTSEPPAPYWGMDATVGSHGSESTLDLNGHDVTFTAGLHGLGDLAVTGDGDLLGNPYMQGRLAGSVSASGAGIKDVSGAAAMSNLTVAAGASVKLGVGGTNCVKMAYMDLNRVGLGRRDQGVYDNMDEAMAYDGDFPYRPSSLGLVHGNFKVTDGVAALADGSAAIYEGQFYAPAAGTYTFAGHYSNGIELKVDGERVFQSVGFDQSQSGTCELTEGWHDFRLVVMNMGSTAFGQEMSGWRAAGVGLAWTNGVVDAASISNAPTGLVRFDTDTLAMRPGGAPLASTAGLVNWKHAPYVSTGSEPTKEQIVQEREWDTDTTISSFQFINTTSDARIKNAVNDISGWFLVPEGEAGDWTFSVGFDNGMYFWVDDNPGIYAIWNPVVAKTYNLAAGWHTFRIRTVDHGGGVGCWRNGNNTVRAQKPGGSLVAFDERNFTFRASVDDLFDALPNGIAGDLTLGTGAVVSNVASTGGCPVRGTVSGAGTLAGQWLLMDGATLAYADVPKTARDLGDYGPRFAGAQPALFRHGGRVAVAFAEQPARQSIKVCPAGGLEGLSTAELAARVSCTVAGGAATWFEPVVKDGWLYLVNLRAGATVVIFR